MAQKKGLIYRLTMGKDDQPDFTPNKLPGTRMAQFWDVLKTRTWNLVKVNLLVILFALPAIAWFVIMSMMKSADGMLIPYSSNIGIGYPVVTDAVAIGNYRAFTFDVQTWLVMIPLLMIASLGLAGAFYTVKKLVWGEGITVGATFFKGIKLNWLPFLFFALLGGVSVFLVIFNIGAYSNYMNVTKALKIVGIAMSILQFVLVAFMLLFLTTQAVTYKLGGWGLVKNSFLFSIALLPQNLIIAVLSALPVLLALVLPQFLSMIFVVFFLLIGVSFIILIWTVYAQWAFDKFINDRVEGAEKNKGMYVPSEEEKRAAAERERKAKNVRYTNPKKKKKTTSIDEGATFTPLSANFSRADLERLAKEKEAVKAQIDAEEDDAADIDSSAGAKTAAVSDVKSKSAEADTGNETESTSAEHQNEKS